MDIVDTLLLALGLSADAFAVSISLGLASGKPRKGDCILTGVWFGVFQAIMPLIGYLLALLFYNCISALAHWIAFALLAMIGVDMISKFFDKKQEQFGASFSFRTMLPLSLATSVDALAVGVTLALTKSGAGIFAAAALIGCVTFILCGAGVGIGAVFGEKIGKKSLIFGGVVLIFLAVKILLEHLGVIGF